VFAAPAPPTNKRSRHALREGSGSSGTRNAAAAANVANVADLSPAAQQADSPDPSSVLTTTASSAAAQPTAAKDYIIEIGGDIDEHIASTNSSAAAPPQQGENGDVPDADEYIDAQWLYSASPSQLQPSPHSLASAADSQDHAAAGTFDFVSPMFFSIYIQ
jgi:hypothetical protein